MIIIFNVVISNFYNNLVYGRAYNNSIAFVATIDESGNFSDENDMLLKQLEQIPYVQTPTITQRLNRFSDFDNVILIIDNDKYLMDDHSLLTDTFSERTLGFSVSRGEHAIFTENDFNVFAFHYSKQQFFLAGNDVSKSGEVLITDFVLKQFGIEDYKSKIGQKISFVTDDDYYFEDLILAGVVNANYYNLPNLMVDSQIVISSSVIDFKSYNFDYAYIYAPIDSFDNSQEVFNILKESDYSNFLILSNESSAWEYSYIVKIQAVIRYVFGFIGIFIIMALFLNLYSTISTHIKNNMSYYGMMHAMGIKKYELHSIFSIELFLIILCSAFISAGVSAFFIRVINYFASSFYYSGEVNIGIPQYFATISGASFFVGLIVFILSNIVLFGIQNRDILKMLNEQS
ncbi:MAG: FtsX-like permease family protein [Lachnospiraceae bacterium]|nr:FtsX-like permease family protein [Lachnospiraceae bacterium]